MSNQSEAIALLKTLNLNENNCWDVYFIANLLKKLGYQKTDFSVVDGASKVCIVFNNKDYVIKWAIENDGYSEAIEEANIYKRAIREHLEALFPKTAILCQINGITYVVQEKVDTCMQRASRKQIESLVHIGQTVKEEIFKRMAKEFNKASREYRRDLDRVWAKAVISLYGKQTVKRLCRFIIENSINDLHLANIGIKNGKPIILDFSGYHR